MLPSRTDDFRETRLYEVKTRIHHRLLERLDLGQLESLDEELVAKEIRQALDTLLDEESEPLNLSEKNRLIQELEFEILGLGPLEPLLKDPGISDILVNRWRCRSARTRSWMRRLRVSSASDQYAMDYPP